MSSIRMVLFSDLFLCAAFATTSYKPALNFRHIVTLLLLILVGN